MDVWAGGKRGGGGVGGVDGGMGAQLSSTCNSPVATCVLALGEGRRGEGERETRTESYLWHSDACLTLEEANHGIEVARMMGYRLSERGGEGGLL